MSDLTMAKVKRLYEDMVQMEQNMVSLEKRSAQRLALLEKKVTLYQLTIQGGASLITSPLKTTVMAASIAFGLGVSLSSQSALRGLLIAIPLVLAVAWAISAYLEQQEASRPAAGEVHHVPLAVSPSTQCLTRDAFFRACLVGKIEGREKAACEDVIFGQMSIEDSAKKHKMFPNAVAARVLKISMQQFQRQE